VGLRCRIGHKDPHLAILALASRPRILPLDARRFDALFEKAGLIKHQDRALVSQVVKHIRQQIIPHRISVPLSGTEQALHAVGCLFAGLFGQLPAILALSPAEQTLEIGQRPLPWLGSYKASRDAGMQPVQFASPAFDLVDAGRINRHHAPPQLRYASILSYLRL
jgi:hypothetical protein